MEKSRPDPSFVRDGIGLAEWLCRLVGEDAAMCGQAGRRLRAMWLASPAVEIPHTEIDYTAIDVGKHFEAFNAAVRDALHGPDFDLPEFIRRLCAVEIAYAIEHDAALQVRRKVDSDWDRRFDRLSDRLLERVSDPPSPAEAEDVTKRFTRLTAAYMCGGPYGLKEISADFENLKNQTYEPDIRSIARQELGASIMLAPEAIHALLANRGTQWQARGLLENAGSAASTFVSMFLDALDASATGREGARDFSARTLAAIGRGSESLVHELIERLGHGDASIRNAVSNTLELLGTDVAGHQREIIDRLWPMLEDENTRYAAMSALASVGRQDSRVRQWVIDRARPKPPRIKSPPDFPNYTYDEAMGERGEAISLMRYFADHAVECLPVLIDAIETFEEYDPDEEYDGPVGRVSDSLASLGPAAAGAALPLARALSKWKEGEDWPQAIFRALAAMGPAAKDALPILEPFWLTHAAEPPETLETLNSERRDPTLDLLGWAIQRIRAS